MFLCFSLRKRKVASSPVEFPLQNIQHNNNRQSKWVTCNIRRRLDLKHNEACLLCPEQVQYMYFGLLLWLRCFVHVHKSYGFFVDCSKMKTNKPVLSILQSFISTCSEQQRSRALSVVLNPLFPSWANMMLPWSWNYSSVIVSSRGKSDQAFLSKKKNIENSAEYI